MKKVFDQTVRDLKREVNKKVLKVPGIEQKILDATSNEPWGPHGSHLADIAQATRNYHEYQMIMQVIWKRLNDNGKNWRHVYKALTVLEYLVGHGSERVIDDIREHAYQISTLSNFQYIDSSGKDQGSNVRRKSQSLVALVNDKEKVQEVRQKAASNRDKYRSTFSTGGRHSSYSGGAGYAERYDDGYDSRNRDSYEGKYRDDGQNGGRDRDWGSRDDDRYGRGGDFSNRDGDRYGRDSDERYGRDSYRDDDYKGRRGNDDSQFGSRSKSLDGDRDRSFEEDDRYYSSRNGGRVDSSQDERRLERKLSEQSPPPSYEEVTTNSNKYTEDGSSRGTANATPLATKAYTPPAAKEFSPTSTSQSPNQSEAGAPALASNNEADGFDEFDPRSSVPAPPIQASSSGVDLFANQSISDPIDSLALVPVSFVSASDAGIPASSGAGTNFVPLSSASTALSQPSEDPFGDGQFKATPQQNFQAAQQSFTSGPSFNPSGFAHGAEPLAQAAFKEEAAPSFDFGDSLGGLTYTPRFANDQQNFVPNPPSMTEFPTAQANNDIFGSAVPSATSSSVPQQPAVPMYTTNANYLPQPAAQPAAAQYPQTTPTNLYSQPGLSIQPTLQTAAGQHAYGQPPKDKFETKSTVWADTLNRGLVNLNISGAKVNPLADIGVDFDALNRVDKRNQKITAAPPVSTITMGKAMGSGSGIGRAGAGGLGSPSNPMMGSGMGMGRGMGMGMGGYGAGMSQPMGMTMGMGMNQGAPMRPPAPGPGVPGVGYSPMMGGYGPQQPYGGGYR